MHTRIDETIDSSHRARTPATSTSTATSIGAVVGVQPFGGEGLSGTGPKAGGPLYLHRLTKDMTQGRSADPAGDRATGSPDDVAGATKADFSRGASDPLHVLRDFVVARAEFADLVAVCERLAARPVASGSRTLTGPTGERNVYTLVPRDAVLCIAFDRGDLLMQFATVLAAGSRRAIWLDNDVTTRLLRELPTALRDRVLIDDALVHPFDAALIQADEGDVAAWSRRLAQRDGPIIGLQAATRGARGNGAFSIERLLTERSLSVNTAAAGGNASLMTIG